MSDALASPAVMPQVQMHQPGLCLVRAPLLQACERAFSIAPEALALADASAWVRARRQAFLAGRVVAAQALSALGCEAAVGRAADGSPRWPSGFVGSIAHDARWAVALVASNALWSAVGVDVEPDAPLPADAAGIVVLAADRAHLRRAFGTAAETHARLVFSAKECVHKAVHPWRGAWLEFDEVSIAFLAQGPDAGRWQAEPLSSEARQAFAGTRFEGEWWRERGALWTLLALRR